MSSYLCCDNAETMTGCSDTYTEIYATVGPAVMICQLLALLEVMHPLLGWVRTGVAMPFMQVSINIMKSVNHLFLLFVQ